MKQDRMLTAAAVVLLVLGFITMLSGHVVYGGVVALFGFGIFYLRGQGGFNKRSLYEKQIKADTEINELYEKLRDMDTPLGKAWIGGHKDFSGDCIIFGPDVFWDCIVVGRSGPNIVMKHTMEINKILRDARDEYRFEKLSDLKEYETTPERYAIYAGFRLSSVIMLDHLLKIVSDI